MERKISFFIWFCLVDSGSIIVCFYVRKQDLNAFRIRYNVSSIGNFHTLFPMDYGEFLNFDILVKEYPAE